MVKISMFQIRKLQTHRFGNEVIKKLKIVQVTNSKMANLQISKLWQSICDICIPPAYCRSEIVRLWHMRPC